MIRRSHPSATLLAAALLVVAPLALAACSAPEAEARAGAVAAAATETASAPRPISEYSVYELEGDWRDQAGEPRALASLTGRVQVMSMVYTNCTATCPLIVSQLQRIEREAEGDVSFVLVSLDPMRDDPERLAAYAGERELDASRWTLLTAPDEDVRALAAVLDVRYRQLTPDDFAHSNVITVLDEDGRVLHQQLGLDGLDETVRVVRSAVR